MSLKVYKNCFNDVCGPFYEHWLTIIDTLIANYICRFLIDVITHPCITCGELAKLSLKVGHGCVITSHFYVGVIAYPYWRICYIFFRYTSKTRRYQMYYYRHQYYCVFGNYLIDIHYILIIVATWRHLAAGILIHLCIGKDVSPLPQPMLRQEMQFPRGVNNLCGFPI